MEWQFNKKGKNYALEIKNKTQTSKIFWHWEREKIANKTF